MSTMAYSQWKQIFQFPSGAHSLYFLDGFGNPEIGFAGLADGEVWRTSDRGGSWQKVLLAPGGLMIDDITFKDALTGWLVPNNRVNGGPSSVYQTLDGGLTWQQERGGLTLTAVYYHEPSKTLFLSEWNSGGFFSTDDGSTWSQFSNQSLLNGYAFAGATNGIVSFAGANPINILTTVDGGLNWQFRSVSPVACWQAAGKPGTNTFFIFSEYNNTLVRSDDNGATWTLISTIGNDPSEHNFTGCTRLGTCGELIVQATGLSDNGMYLSSDEGVTWNSIGGPSNEVDTRFCVSGNKIFATDFNGSLWVYQFNYGVSTFSPQLRTQNNSTRAFLQPGKDTVLTFSVSGDIQSSLGLDSMNFDLHFNPDMLNLDSANAPSGRKIRIRQLQSGWYNCIFYNTSHSDILADQPLAFFYFSSYLTKDTISSVLLRAGNAFFDPQKHAGCSIAAMPQDDSVSIQAADTCTDKTIRNFLVTGTIDTRILSIRPNPASHEIEIETESPSLQEVNAIIYDDMGREYRNEKRRLQGAMILIFPISSLPAGTYHFVLRSSSGSVSSDFIKLR